MMGKIKKILGIHRPAIATCDCCDRPILEGDKIIELSIYINPIVGRKTIWVCKRCIRTGRMIAD